MLSAMASMWVTIHWASSGLSWNPSSSRTAGARDPANLADGGGGFRADQVGKGVDGLEAIG